MTNHIGDNHDYYKGGSIYRREAYIYIAQTKISNMTTTLSHSLALRIRKLLAMTDTELKAMAADATMGDNSTPNAG